MRTTVMGQSKLLYGGQFDAFFLKATNVLCSDGVRRVATASGNGVPDTFFSIPARVKARGRTISGYVTPDDDGSVRFVAYSYGKNGHLLPGIR